MKEAVQLTPILFLFMNQSESAEFYKKPIEQYESAEFYKKQIPSG